MRAATAARAQETAGPQELGAAAALGLETAAPQGAVTAVPQEKWVPAAF